MTENEKDIKVDEKPHEINQRSCKMETPKWIKVKFYLHISSIFSSLLFTIIGIYHQNFILIIIGVPLLVMYLVQFRKKKKQYDNLFKNKN